MRKEKRKEGKDPEGGSKKRKEAANGNFCYNAQLQTGKEIGLGEAAQAEPVRRSEKDTHDIQGTETVHAIVPKRSVDPKCIPKPFIRGALCDTSVDDVTMVKERISFNSFPNICRGASFLSVAGVQWMESATGM
jgi:hypothetical protein